MMHPFMTYDDNSELIRSDLKPDGRVRVHIETPDELDCLHTADCWIPGYTWWSVDGYSAEELQDWQGELVCLAPVILDLAREEAGFYAEAV